MKNPDFLQSRPKEGKTSFSLLGVSFEDVMNLPITCLELTGHAKRLIVDNSIKISSTNTKSLKTIGDLVRFGYDNLEYYLMQKCEGNSYQEVLYEIELSLAKFSLKLAGSDFSVCNILVRDLNFPSRIVKLLNKNYIADIEQLCMANGYLINRFSGTDEGKEMLKEIKIALRNFGVKFKTKIETAEHKPQKTNVESSTPKIPKIFPKILENLNKTQTAATLPPTEKSVAMEKANYSNCEYDYSGLIDVVNSHFKTLSGFLKACGVDRRTLKLILSGEKIYQGTLEKLCEYFGVQPKDLVTYNCKLPPCKIKGVTYDYAKILTKLFSKYTNQRDIKNKLKMSNTTLRKMMKGEPVQRAVILKLCQDLKIRAQDVITVDKTETQNNSEYLPDVDYSKLHAILKKNALSIQSLCERLGISPFQTVYFKVSHGKHLKPEQLSAMANYLSVSPQDLVTINRTANEVKEQRRQERIRAKAEYDYSKLFELLYSRFHTSDLEAVAKKYGIPFNSTQNIRLGKKISDNALNKYARLLGCTPDKLFVSINPQKTETAPQTKQTEKACDYTKLQLLLDRSFKSLAEASRKIGISRGLFTRINNGEILGFTTYKTLMEYFKVSLDDLCEFKRKEDRKKILSKIYHPKEDASSPNYMDFSKLLELLKKRKLSHIKFKTESGIGNETLTRILSNRRLSNETLRKITDYLQCDLSDIIDMSQYKSRIPNFENTPYDYSKLYKLLEARGKGTCWLAFGAGLPSTGYISYFKNGRKVSDDIMEKICKFLGCSPEDIVTPNPEVIARLQEEHRQKLRRKKPRKKVVAVHSDKLISSPLAANTTDAEPNESVQQTELEETLIQQETTFTSTEAESELVANAELPHENDSSAGQGGSGSSNNNPNGVKFYFGANGYINMLGDRVKKYIEKSPAELSSAETEIFERTL